MNNVNNVNNSNDYDAVSDYDALSVREKILRELQKNNHDYEISTQVTTLKNCDIVEENNNIVEENNNKNTIFDLEELSISDKIKCEELIMEEVNRRVKERLEYETIKLNKKLEKKIQKDLDQLDRENNKNLKKEELLEKKEKLLLAKKKLNNAVTVELDIRSVNITTQLKLIEDKEQILKSKEESFKIFKESGMKRIRDEMKLLNKLRKLFESNENNQFIQINIGGKIFSTTTNTLKEYSSYFQGLLSGNFNGGLKDKDGNIFIDRCPVQFETILKIMRNPNLEYKVTEELANEMDYYLIDFESVKSNMEYNDVKSEVGSINESESEIALSNSEISLSDSD